MGKSSRLILLIVLIFIPIIFYNSLNKKGEEIFEKGKQVFKPKVALIFDDLGESLKDLKEIYSLSIPLSISVIPGLKFSRNIAHIGYRCGFSVLIHLPFEPETKISLDKYNYKFISSSLSKREVDSLLRYYLNFIRVAIGVNVHMGSEVTKNTSLMKQILKAIKRKRLIFIDSNTNSTLHPYHLAKKEDLVCGYNEGFLDSEDDLEFIENRLEELIKRAEEKGKTIIIAHPRKNTLNVLKQKIPSLKKRVEFITLKDYFGL
ncbi:MAG TPA: divergent polysaccharide deacetylase family protein [Candidatus Omnitrophica bacterium]|nr:divergent polysaccharide deacetylase family protein [Candidatus Omnitrophota bacterium]